MAKKKHDEPGVEDEAPVAAAQAIDESPGQFPKMVYGPGGARKVVANADAQRRLGADWQEDPPVVA
jgi:hypothetical protein